MSLKAKVVIIHGAYGSADENWFPWLRDRVLELGHEALVPSFPTPDGQSLASWIEVFAQQVGPLTPDTILVGHSLGPGFILNLLERTEVSIRGTFIASGFLGNLGLPDFDKVNETFVCREFDWEKIRRNAGKVHVYNSDSDPYVPLDKGVELAGNLGVELTVIHNGGHLNSAGGFTTFPQLLSDLKDLLGD